MNRGTPVTMTDDAVRAALEEALTHHRGGRLAQAEAIYRRLSGAVLVETA